MADPGLPRTISAITFVMRSRLFALEQGGRAVLLPWLQRYTGASPLPGLPRWCLGLLNVRGTVQMAVDLGDLLGLGPSEVTTESRLIFIEYGSAQLGLLVDAEIGVRYLQVPAAPGAEDPIPFFGRTAWLDSHTVAVLDGARIAQHVAEQLGASAFAS